MMKREVQEALQALADKNGGRITPDIVVKAAKDKRSPLYGEFNWNVKQAAYEHWLDTARKLIRGVTIKTTVHKHEVTVPKYLRDPMAKPKQQGYASITSIRQDKEQSRIAAIRELSTALSWLERAKNIAEVLGVHKRIERTIKSVERTIDELRV